MRWVSDGHSDTTSMVKSLGWDVTGMPGCCGAMIIRRLYASYCKDVDYNDCVAYGHSVNMGNISQAIKGVSWHRPRHYAPVPLWLGYSACLQDMRAEQGRRNVLWFASDNVSGRGDVHRGVFSTRDFIEWLKEEKLATVATSPRCGRNVGHTFQLIRPACAAQMRKALVEYRKIKRLCGREQALGRTTVAADEFRAWI